MSEDVGQGADRLQEGIEGCLEALIEKDRQSYLRGFVQGLIHNINSPLQNMSMLVEILIRGQEQFDRFVRESDCQGLVEEWEANLERQRKRYDQLSQQIVSLAEMMRDFMVLYEIERSGKNIDLKILLARLARVFRADLFFKHQVTLDLQLSKNLPLIPIPGSHLVPAFVNIIRNALTALRDAPQKRLTIESKLVDGRVILVFSDTGCGVADGECEESCFDLFYSRWPQSSANHQDLEKHLGLGLFAVRHLLSPFGVKAILRGGECGAQLILEFPPASGTK